jgi:hypothetical protein
MGSFLFCQYVDAMVGGWSNNAETEIGHWLACNLYALWLAEM